MKRIGRDGESVKIEEDVTSRQSLLACDPVVERHACMHAQGPRVLCTTICAIVIPSGFDHFRVAIAPAHRFSGANARMR